MTGRTGGRGCRIVDVDLKSGQMSVKNTKAGGNVRILPPHPPSASRGPTLSSAVVSSWHSVAHPSSLRGRTDD